MQHNYPLKHLNTFGLDVKARYFLEVTDPASMKQVFAREAFLAQPHMILGGGSNVLFSSDYPGTVIRIKTQGKHLVSSHPDHVIIEAQAGEEWDQLVAWTVENNWGGLENLSLIPGQAGTSPIQNIGAYGVELKDVFHSLVALEISTGTLHTFLAEDCQFGYRYSIFKGPAKGRFVILSVRYRLTAGEHHINTGYGAIGRELQAMGVQQPTIADVRQAVCAIRHSKLPDPKVTGNAGSFFKNPVVGTDLFNKLSGQYPDLVAYPAPAGMKLAAGWLIEKAGWKGFRRSDVGVHPHQALVLVNYGNASGAQILELSREIQQSVSNKFGVELQPEVNIL
ncbi:MAG: UDP-N-acetylmuramate dehydrogenase [Bacteroidales bacterium]